MSRIKKNTLLNYIPNNFVIENEINFSLESMKTIKLALRNPDFTTSKRVAAAINAMMGEPSAKAVDPSTITLDVPSKYQDNIVDLMTKIEQLQVQPDQTAKVIIDETSGIVVIGKDVKISKLAIAQGNLTIKISEIPLVSQPFTFSDGETVVDSLTDIQIEEDTESKLSVLDTGVNLQDLVNGLNALGVSPRDLISILQAVKASGALQADIEVI